MSLESRKTKLLNYLLPLVEATGWSNDNLKKACDQAGESFVELFSITAKPVDDMITTYSNYLNAEMLQISQDNKFNELRIRDKIAALVMARLKAIEPFKDAGYKTLTYLAMPQNFLLAQRLKCKTINDMWYTAGDNATDYNYYTKRLLLSGVYSATLLYWFKDQSPDSIATRRFLDRRIDNVMSIYKVKATLKQIFPLFNRKKSV